MKKTVVILLVLAVFIAGCAGSGAVRADKPPEPKKRESGPPAFLGVSMTAAPDLKPIEGVTAKHGVRVHFAVPDSPADKAGIKSGDIIVAVGSADFDAEAKDVLQQFRDRLAQYFAGDTARIKVVREETLFEVIEGGKKVENPERVASDLKKHMQGKDKDVELSLKAKNVRHVLAFDVKLTEKPASGAGKYTVPPDEEIYILPPGFSCPAEKLAEELVEHYAISSNYQDLRERLRKLETSHEGFRIPYVAYLHRNPFRMEHLAQEILDTLSEGVKDKANATRRLAQTAIKLSGKVPGESKAAPLKTGLTLEEHLAQLEKVLESAAACHKKAFAALTTEDRKFLLDNMERLGEVFEEMFYIHTNENREEFDKHLRMIELAKKIDLTQLFAAFLQVREVTDADYLAGLEKDLRDAGVKLAKKFVAEKETPFGRIVIGGTGDNWYKDKDAAVIIDLGGNDFYTNNSGSSTAEIPCAVVADVKGNDAYESTRSFAQGTGLLGVGILADLSGDDSYVGIRWCQGTCACGIGLLFDGSGSDTYRSHGFAQSAALWGISVLCDTGGNDRYESHTFSQGLGMCGGVAVLCDSEGSDSYYAKGTHPTGYGTPGVYEGWSQGCGVGFRQYGSGGIGIILDLQGADHYEAGNFSQGGGYYYGWGILGDRGKEDDTYIGSRYAQGFCAHQALGTFIEEDGNETYASRNAVHAGLAWDECVTLFLDRSGDDNYSCPRGFSQGASAHNAICIFMDLDGTDRYASGAGPGRAGGNDYHGGTSLSFFLDLGGQKDSYVKRGENDSVSYEPEDSLVLDLPGRDLTRLGDIIALCKPYEPPKKKEEKKQEPEKPEKTKKNEGKGK